MVGLVSEQTFASADTNTHGLRSGDIGRMIVSHVAREFALDSAALFGTTRGSPGTAFARQIAMYLVHVGFALDFATIGRVFGRDRTTVAHACSVVENRRDDIAFDLRITMLETLCCTGLDGHAR